MKKYFVAVTALLALTAVAIFAADVDGKWTRETQGKNGPQTTTLTLKADGGKLTGTMEGGRGGAQTVTDGTITGANVSFKIVRDLGEKGKQEQTYKGTVSATELKLTVEGGFGGGGGGKGGGGGEQVYTKAK